MEFGSRFSKVVKVLGNMQGVLIFMSFFHTFSSYHYDDRLSGGSLEWFFQGGHIFLVI